MIRDINSQVSKALNEIELRYSKGMKFTLQELIVSQSYFNESNYQSCINVLQSKLNLSKMQLGIE